MDENKGNSNKNNSDECMNDNRDNEILDRLLCIAEFGAKRHDDRRTVEFRIFISYMTPLILAVYYAFKLDCNRVLPISWWIIGGVAILYFLTIHCIYVLWQIGVAVAMANDAWRRNFYLKKAECILHHLSTENGDSPFSPSDDENRKVRVNCGYEKREWTEKELFEKPAPNIILVKNFWELHKHRNQIFGDWSRALVVVLPTILAAFLLGILVLKKMCLI